jgi:hypothetical protein
MRDWLKYGSIPDDADMRGQLEGREYGYVLRDGRDAIQLESKKDMKKRGLSSPDVADALALTFAYRVQPRPDAGGQAGGNRKTSVQTEYDPFA